MNIQLVGSDMDGMLVDALPFWKQANTDAFAQHHIEFTDAQYHWYITTNKGLPDLLVHMELDPQLAGVLDEQRNEIYDALLSSHVEWIKGVPELLESLRSADYSLGIVTTAKTRNVRAISSRLHLDEFFTKIVTRDDVGTRKKPDGYGIELLQQHFDVSPALSAYLGDQLTDMQAATRSGACGILVPNSYTPEAAHAEAKHVFKDAHALREAIFERGEPLFYKG